MTKKEKMGFFSLGIAFDYFLGRPVRKLKPFWYVTVGFVLGVLYSAGLDKIFACVTHFTK